jgi:hypothetical protein
MPSLRRSVPDPLDLDLEDIFGTDVSRDEPMSQTVHALDHIPPPSNGDDAEPPAPEDLGRAWLAHATEAEYSVRESDLIADQDRATIPDLDSEPASEQDFRAPDRH